MYTCETQKQVCLTVNLTNKNIMNDISPKCRHKKNFLTHSAHVVRPKTNPCCK